MDRRDHRGARRREGGSEKLWRAAAGTPTRILRSPHDGFTPRPPAGTCLPSSARSCRRHGWRRPRRSACGRASATGSGAPCRRPDRSAISIRRPSIGSRSASSAAAAAVALPVAGSSDNAAGAGMKHPRLQVAWLLAGRHIARIEIDRIAAVARKGLGERRRRPALPAAAHRARRLRPPETTSRPR